MNNIKQQKNDDKPRCSIGKAFLELSPTSGRYTFQRRADQRTSGVSGHLINKILISM